MKATGKDKHASAQFALTAGAVLLGSLACARVAQCVMEPKRLEGVAAYVAATQVRDANQADADLAGARETAQAVKEKNLFVKAPPKENPIKQVDGILGGEVLIQDKWYKAGDKVADATIVSVEPTHVTVEWNGQKTVVAPLAAADSEGPVVAKPPTVEAKEAKVSSNPPAIKAPDPQVTVTPTVVEDDPLAWMGVELSPELRAMIMEKWNGASEEERQEAKDEWNRMSDDEKQSAIDSFERSR